MTIIRVTEDDIRDGKPMAAGACPIALALNRTFGILDPLDKARVGSFAIIAWRRPFLCSEFVARWVNTFDDGDPVDPFAFELETGEIVPCE